MKLHVITAICAALWLILALAGPQIEKRWRADLLGGLMAKEAVLVAVKTALALVRMATLTYGVLALVLWLMPQIGEAISQASYQAFLEFLTPVRNVLSFFSGGLGRACFATVIAVFGWRVYRRYAAARRGPSAPREQRRVPSWVSDFGGFFVSKQFFRKVKLFGKYTASFGSIVFFLSLVGVSGSVVDQELKDRGVPSSKPILASSAEVKSDKETARESRLVLAPEPDAQGEQAANAADKELGRDAAEAIVDALARSDVWTGLIDELQIDHQNVPKAAAGTTPAIDLAEKMLAEESDLRITAAEGRFNQARILKNLKNVTPHGTPELGIMALDGFLGASTEFIPAVDNEIGAKAQKILVKGAQGASAAYVKIAVMRVATRMKSGGTFLEALNELKALHRIDLSQAELATVTTVLDDAARELAKLGVTEERGGKVFVKPTEVSVKPADAAIKPTSEGKLVSTIDKPLPAPAAQDPPFPGTLQNTARPDPLNPGKMIVLERGIAKVPPAEIGLFGQAACALLRVKRCRVH